MDDHVVSPDVQKELREILRAFYRVFPSELDRRLAELDRIEEQEQQQQEKVA